ncbi:hypothetical protein GLOIN_2v1486989 [Rhizophagus irregularis DAOM 181602=DAOM 197198]|uniref:Uncharacterized protein n=1 Tax=Rhizophagus irregularis (strain DAOM 181602 / DAOM 197198 / MUCL 43194) TaxID=747089 RepID=A0A2P4P505_RHIID|nr:hypothetical protein GLOIN_2v1486989 [Rhizophagus irregularis DAOM 181602=DAOM 197198]POG60462.1 hypothetical protein GLOIN_2v1486989 [Rhizophagus irregularis DAOM 181602=DAOM 197198]|eukprot:XP_025167328.1 hypothetical protein GLOIN_2v1486989 [Rhizophagus irregularis DAOM 181602=DAOM 197198]
MSTERTLETHVQSEDNYIDIIDIENHTPVTSPLDNTNIEEYTKNAFDKLLNKEEHDLDFQAKNKGGSKFRSWVIEKEALIAALLDPRKKKTAFANNEQKRRPDTSWVIFQDILLNLYEVGLVRKRQTHNERYMYQAEE